jgi:hypothetical protein
MRKVYLAINLLAGILVTASQISAAAQAADPLPPNVPARYSAVAFGQAGPAAGKSFGLSIFVDGVTADGDRDELVATLKRKGQHGLLSAIGDQKDKGRVSPTGSVGTGIRVVRIRPLPNGGQHIVLVTDRPLSFGEVYYDTRSRDYPFTIVVLNVDQNGKGTGSLAPLCKITFNKKNEIEIENFGQKPFRLANVRRDK